MVNDGTITKEEMIENKEKNDKKKKIPKETTQEILKKIFRTLLKAIAIMLYFITLNLAYSTMKQERLVGDIEVFASTFLVIGIVFLERAYKKDSGTIAINGIEFLVLSLHSLSIMHVITLFKYDFRFYLLTSSYIFSIYYVFKAIILYTKGKRDYLKSLSDVSEIVKKDEPMKKEAKKRNVDKAHEKKAETKKEKMNKNNENTSNIKRKTMNSVNKKKKESIDEDSKTESKIKKQPEFERTKVKKKINKEIEKNDILKEEKNLKTKSKIIKEEKITESKNKSKAKTETLKKKTADTKVKVKAKTDEVVETEKKKRGRPKKEVTKND